LNKLLVFQTLEHMKTPEINTTIIESYIGLLDNLSPSSKLDLISKLTESVKTDLTRGKTSLKEAFGAFDSAKSAEEIIEEIQSSRVFNRHIESL
jgi:hypothetical protein